jgi:hypothetical protein
MVVAAGAIHRGKSLAAALMWGAKGVWVGEQCAVACGLITLTGLPQAHAC